MRWALPNVRPSCTYEVRSGSISCLRDGCARRTRSNALVWAAALLGLAMVLPANAFGQFSWPRVPQLPTMHQAPGGGAPGQTVSTTPHPAVARIIVPEKDGQSYGSGTLIDVNGQHGLVVTNWHVVRDASAEITAVFPDGSRSPAQVVKVDKDWDLAALSVWRPTSAAPVPIAALAPKPGEVLTIAGYGSGDYRAAAGVCTQYLAPSASHPYELVEVAAEARQGDSGGPIFNERGELAGVLFGSGPGYTSGSYAGRVREFLVGVIPPSSGPAASTALAATPPVSPPSNPLPPTVPPPPQPQETPPPPPPQTPANPLASSSTPAAPSEPAAPEAPGRLAEVGMGFTPPSPLPVAPLEPAPPLTAEPVPLIADLESRAFESEPPLTPVKPEGATAMRRPEGEEYVDPRTAVTPPPAPTERRYDDDLEVASRRDLGRLSADEIERARPIQDDPGRLSAAAGRIAMVPHSPLPPRPGVAQPAAISNASADQLLSAAWHRIAGTTFWDQAKTVLAIFGALALLIQFWRLNSQQEPQPEAD
jgi:serine protease Do